MRFLGLLLFILATVSLASAWNLDKHSIPVDEIMSGGPEKEQVIGVNLNGEARAYPLRIMSWHELVNDRIGDLPILVSW